MGFSVGALAVMPSDIEMTPRVHPEGQEADGSDATPDDEQLTPLSLREM